MQTFYFVLLLLAVATAASVTFAPCTRNIPDEVPAGEEKEICKPERAFPGNITIQYQIGKKGVLDPTVDLIVQTKTETKDFIADGDQKSVTFYTTSTIQRIAIKNKNSVFAFNYVNVQMSYEIPDTPAPTEPGPTNVGLIVGLTLGTLAAICFIGSIAAVIAYCGGKDDTYGSI
jgi:hypothetical protein